MQRFDPTIIIPVKSKEFERNMLFLMYHLRSSVNIVCLFKRNRNFLQKVEILVLVALCIGLQKI